MSEQTIRNIMKGESSRDTEEEKLRKTCRSCGSKNIVLVRYDHGAPTQKLITSCTKDTCHKHVDVDAIGGAWRPKNGAI